MTTAKPGGLCDTCNQYCGHTDPDKGSVSFCSPDPGWFSESSTSMVRLTPKVWKQKRRLLKLSKIFALKTFKNLLSFEVQSPVLAKKTRILIPGF